MSTTRIKAISATATSYAGDDYLPIDGNNNGTRNILITSLFDSPSAIGNLTPATGKFTTLSASGAVSDTAGNIRDIPQNSQSSDYTLALTDAGKQIFHPSADTTARTFTIPSNSSVPFDVGVAVSIINQNAAGVITIAITTDVMRLAGVGSTGSRSLAANGIATIVKVTSTEWIISGTGVT